MNQNSNEVSPISENDLKIKEAIDSYGSINKSYASNYRDYLDIQPNISVKSEFNRSDYYSFRPSERTPNKQKRIIKMCMDAYDKVGIIRNIIDLMGDFGSQGINIVHESRSVEDFFKEWFKKVNGKERSERFLNNLYKSGNVVIYKNTAKITPDIKKYIKSLAADLKVEMPEVEESVIPWKYNFINPQSVDVKNSSMNMFLGKKSFEISIDSFMSNFKDSPIPKEVLDYLPEDMKNKIKKGERKIPLDPEKLSISYYKKDDWMEWANPMIYAILDDIIMLEKMRLADLSALDGAISNIRLWTLGSLEHKIIPTRAAIDKLRNILAANSGGGTMELVWGPELAYTESNSQVYKFLGSEKYESVLNSIYAGLGVPPTLTGAGGGGGFTNNFISLKTLVERLQYGRDLLTRFWEKEIEEVRRAMGFRKSAYITYDQMSLADEASEKNLLIQLADRDLISQETILERFKEIPSVEKMRIKREIKEREQEKLPPKTSPYHNPQHMNDLEKIGLQSGKLTPQDVGLKTSVPTKLLLPPDPNKPATTPGVPQNSKKPVSSPKGGRPNFKQDSEPRKKRVDKPKSKPGLAELFVWTQSAFDMISETTNEAFLAIKNKSNMRKLTKSEEQELEKIKLDILTNTEVCSKVTKASIQEILSKGLRCPNKFYQHLVANNINPIHMPIEDYKKNLLGAYVENIQSSYEETAQY